MHDNALAKELGRRPNVECLLTPVYTPIRTDESDVSIDRVFFGGINIYLQQKMPWLSYLPRWLDAGLSHPALIRRVTKNTSTSDPKFLGALTVSMLRGMEGNQRKETQRLVEWLQIEKPDHVIFTNLLIGGCIPEIKKRIDCKVTVALQGDDIFYEYLPEPFRSQTIASLQRLVGHVDRFITYSRRYASKMAGDIRIPDSLLEVIPLGIELNDLPASLDRTNDENASSFQNLPPTPETPSAADNATAQRRNRNAWQIGYLARLAPEKGLHRLVDAFIELKRMPDTEAIQLHIAGWLGKQHEDYWKALQEKMISSGLDGHWRYWGSVDRQSKIEFLRQIDLLSVPVNFEEPKGLYVLESVAMGRPYCQPDIGAFSELHQRLQCGTLFDPSHLETPSEYAKALRDGLARLSTQDKLSDNAMEQPKQQKSLDALRNEISITTMADRMLTLLSQI